MTGTMLRGKLPYFWHSLVCCTPLCIGLLVYILFIQSNYTHHKLPSFRNLAPTKEVTRKYERDNSSIFKNIKRVCDGESSKINKTKCEISETVKKLKSREPGPTNLNSNLDFLGELSESQISRVVDSFKVPNLNSSILNRQFLACSGLYLLKRTVKFDGIVYVPKHFQNCRKMSFQKSGITAALLSFPGSGNSWVRQLLETVTGIYTGAYKDCDLSYIDVGMIGEGVYTNNVIAVKIHFPNHADLMLTHKIIYIVRNPFDSIIADWNRKYSVLRNPLTAHVSTTRKENFGKPTII